MLILRGSPSPEDVTRSAEVALLDEADDLLACIVCHSPITSGAARIEVLGAHRHQRENPHGIRYEVGCFAFATGLRVLDVPATEWTWFPPYAWQVEVCGACGTHLGWLFSTADSEFHGLILDRLVEMLEGGDRGSSC